MKQFEELYNQLHDEIGKEDTPKEGKGRIVVDGKYVESIIGSNPKYMKFIMTEDKRGANVFSDTDAEKYRDILVEQGTEKVLVTLLEASDREVVMDALKQIVGENFFMKTTEEFNGREGGIWTSNEDWFTDSEGNTVSIMSELYEVHPEIQAIMDEHEWWIEPYDAGTLMIYPR